MASSDDEREALLAGICSRLDAAAVQHIGKILVVYRANPEAPATPAKPAKKTRLARQDETSRPPGFARDQRLRK